MVTAHTKLESKEVKIALALQPLVRKLAKCGDKKFGKDRCVRRKFPDSVVRDCPIKNPLFLPDSIAVVGEIF